MRTRGIVVSLLAAVLLVPVGPAGADQAVVGVQGTATTHEPGHPGTTESWRTLTQAGFTGTSSSGQWTGTGRLAGAPPAGASIRVSWSLGRQHPTGCEGLIGFSREIPSVGADGSFSVSGTSLPGDVDASYTCLSVTLSTNDVVTDWVTGPLTPLLAPSGVEAEPSGGRFLVAAARTTPAIVMVISHGRVTSGATVTGTGVSTDLPPTVTGAIDVGRPRPVVVQVTAAQDAGATDIRLTARDDRDSTAFDGTYAVLARTLEEQRPKPGRYRSADSRVRFRVDADHRVRRLQVGDVPCLDRVHTQAYRLLDLELEMPRSGALARVLTTGDPSRPSYHATQLLTVSRNRIVGTFATSNDGCVGSRSFTARRLG